MRWAVLKGESGQNGRCKTNYFRTDARKLEQTLQSELTCPELCQVKQFCTNMVLDKVQLLYADVGQT